MYAKVWTTVHRPLPNIGIDVVDYESNPRFSERLILFEFVLARQLSLPMIPDPRASPQLQLAEESKVLQARRRLKLTGTVPAPSARAFLAHPTRFERVTYA